MAAGDNHHQVAATDALQENVNRYLPFLMELRKRILFLFSVFLVFGIAGFIYYEKIISFSLRLLDLKQAQVVFTSPFQFLNLAISSGLLCGIAAIFPLLILQILSFLKPALKPKEYKFITYLAPISLLLFIFGFGFGAVMMKYVIDLLNRKALALNIGNFLDINTLLSTILLTSSLMGLAFQFPIVLTGLLRLKIITYKFLAKQRIFVYLALLLFVMLLPPTDVFTDFLLALPLAFLFEITLLLNKLFNKPQAIRKEDENV